VKQKKDMLCFTHDFYTWKYDRLFPRVENILNKENVLYVRHVECGPNDNTNVTHMALGWPSVWHAWPKQCATPPSTEDGNAYRFSEIHGRNSASSTRIQLIF
jgi:hypothetical protein